MTQLNTTQQSLLGAFTESVLNARTIDALPPIRNLRFVVCGGAGPYFWNNNQWTSFPIGANGDVVWHDGFLFFGQRDKKFGRGLYMWDGFAAPYMKGDGTDPIDRCPGFGVDGAGDLWAASYDQAGVNYGSRPSKWNKTTQQFEWQETEAVNSYDAVYSFDGPTRGELYTGPNPSPPPDYIVDARLVIHIRGGFQYGGIDHNDPLIDKIDTTRPTITTPIRSPVDATKFQGGLSPPFESYRYKWVVPNIGDFHPHNTFGQPPGVYRMGTWKGSTYAHVQEWADFDTQLANWIAIVGGGFTPQIAGFARGVDGYGDWLLCFDCWGLGNYTFSTTNARGMLAWAPDCQVSEGFIASVDPTTPSDNTFTITIDGGDSVSVPGNTDVDQTAKDLIFAARAKTEQSFIDFHWYGKDNEVRAAGIRKTVSASLALSVTGSGSGTVTNFTNLTNNDDKVVSWGPSNINPFVFHLDGSLSYAALDEQVDPPVISAIDPQFVDTGSSFNLPTPANPAATRWHLPRRDEPPTEPEPGRKEETWKGTILSVHPTAGTHTYSVTLDGSRISVPGVGGASATQRRVDTADDLVAALNAAGPPFDAITWTSLFFQDPHGTIQAKHDTPGVPFEPVLEQTHTVNKPWDIDRPENFEGVTPFDKSVQYGRLGVPGALTIDIDAGGLSWASVTKPWSNPHNISLYASNDGGWDTLEFSMVIQEDAPILQTLSNVSWTEWGLGWGLRVFLDQGDPVVTLTQDAGPANPTITPQFDTAIGPDAASWPTGWLIRWPRASLAAGSYPITLRATNNKGFNTKSFTLTVTHSAPSFNPESDHGTPAGVPYSNIIVPVDSTTTGPTSWIFISTPPSGMTVQAYTFDLWKRRGIIEWPNPVVGVYPITVRGSNDVGFQDVSFTLTVT